MSDEPSTRLSALAREVMSVEPAEVAAALHSAATAEVDLPVVGTGLAASPGVGSGPLVTSVDAALDAFDRGEEPVLVAEQTGPADEPAMRVAAAVVTARGGLASHAAVVARGWGLPAVCGVESVLVAEDHIRIGDRVIARGEWITVDGSTGEVRLGGVGTGPATGLSAELRDLLAGADELAAGRPAVWANADRADEARTALDLGAQGIGLCRTEHLFLGDRLPLLQQVLLRGTNEALEELAGRQRQDFVDLLEAADGYPVTVRLLDPPVHEFLPRVGDPESSEELARLAAAWREENPMLGIRGVRLGLMRPELIRLQVDAVLAAAAERLSSGGDPRPRLLVPMVTWPSELDAVRSLVHERAASAPGRVTTPPVGAMVETPAAALGSAALAERADFLSFGTNDLTQLVLGLSRDDTEARLLPAYRNAGLHSDSPFERLDPAVVRIMHLAVEGAGDVPVGLCGEHGGDEWSVGRCREMGVSTVSCSPYRVPLARLAAGRAAAREILAGSA